MSAELKSIDRADCFDAGMRAPQKQGPPYGPCEKWVHKSGHVTWVRLSTSPALRDVNNPYAAIARERMRNAGGLRYADCPLRTGIGISELPLERQSDRPCELGAHNDRVGACPHVELIIASRQAAQTKAELEFELRYSAKEKIEQQQREAQTRASADQNAMLTQVLGKLLEKAADEKVARK